MGRGTVLLQSICGKSSQNLECHLVLGVVGCSSVFRLPSVYTAIGVVDSRG